MEFPGMVLTEAGVTLLAKALIGTELNYTRVGLGNETMPVDRGAWASATEYAVDDVVTVTGPAELICVVAHTSGVVEASASDAEWDAFTGTCVERELTDILNEVMSVPIVSLAVPGDGTARIRFRIANTNLVTGFWLEEIGLFAMDPDDGEILYAVTHATASDFIPPSGGVTTLEQYVDLICIVSDAENITAEINELLVTATLVDLSTVSRRAYFYNNTM